MATGNILKPFDLPRTHRKFVSIVFELTCPSARIQHRFNKRIRFVRYLWPRSLCERFDQEFPHTENIMIQTFNADRFEPTGASREPAPTTFDQPSTMANLVMLEQGLYALEIGDSPNLRGRVSGLQVPAVQVSAPRDERACRAEIIGASGCDYTWLDREGGTVIVKSPAGGAHVLVTAYGLPAQAVALPDIRVRRLDRPRSNGVAPRSVDPSGDPEEI
jgi:hypothetical protein